VQASNNNRKHQTQPNLPVAQLRAVDKTQFPSGRRSFDIALGGYRRQLPNLCSRFPFPAPELVKGLLCFGPF
jgi:hypothetical protein